jgi:hypothetical protein
VRGKSVVGAEISGPALPRFTSGVAAARLVKEDAVHKRLRDGNDEDSKLCCLFRSSRQRAQFICASQRASRLHNSSLGSHASSPPQQEQLLNQIISDRQAALLRTCRAVLL